MVVIVFRWRIHPGVEADIDALGGRMYALASAMPGFVSYEEYAGADGAGVALIEFETHAALEVWRDHPEHREAQQAGRDRFFSEYRITVCDSVRESRHPVT